MPCSLPSVPVRRKFTDSPGPRTNDDGGVLSGRQCDVSRETQGARSRSGLGRRNTMSKGTINGRPDLEELAGRARVTPPTASGVKERDDFGLKIPNQGMARPTNPEETLRTRVTSRKNEFRDSATPVDRKTDTNHAWPATYAFDGTAKVSRATPRAVPRDEPLSMR